MKTKIKVFEKSEGMVTFFHEESRNSFSFQRDYIDFTVEKVLGYIFVYNYTSPKGRKNMAFEIYKEENGEYKIFMIKHASQLSEGEK